MSFILDFCVVLIIGLCVWSGIRKGFIKTFFGLFGSLIAYFFTMLAAKPVGGWIAGLLFPSVKERFLVAISDATGEAVGSIDFSELPESCNAILARFGTSPQALSEKISEQVSGSEQVEAVAEMVAKPIAESIGFAIAAVVLFVVFSVLVRIAVNALDLIAKLPGLNASNRLLGLGAGLIRGIFYAILFSSLLTLAAPALSESDALQGLRPDGTILVRFFGSFDLLGALIGS